MADIVTVTPVSVPSRKSNIMSWWESITKASQAPSLVTNHVREGVHVFRSAFEALGTGGILGLIEAEKGNLDINGIPIDGVIAGLGYFGSIYFANDPYGISLDLRNIASDAFSVLAYRKAKAWREKGTRSYSSHGDLSDPIVAAANDL
jgi:hypothetical protein